LNFSPIKKKRVYQIILEQIQSSIESRELKPGDRLPSEREMAELLTVSRNAVREAISVLESIGVVTILQGKGVFLKEDDHNKLLEKMKESAEDHSTKLIELLEVRQGIEGQAAYLAAIRRTNEDLYTIQSAYERLVESVHKEKIAASEDFDFHYCVVKASHNPLLMKAVELFSEMSIVGLNQSRIESMKIPGKSRVVLAEHHQIYQAIKNQDPVLAQQTMFNHLEEVRKRYLNDNRRSLT
jgi:GntR family transcriptional repressor for pyruvate dehydrogenase complex